MLLRVELPLGCEVPGRASSRLTGSVRTVAVASCGLGVIAIGAAATTAAGATTVSGVAPEVGALSRCSVKVRGSWSADCGAWATL
jgi:hypothetical protein